MKVAALDLGSNTFLMLIAEVKDGRVTHVYRDELRVTRLGQGMHANKSFHEEALARAEACFQDYAKIIKEEAPEKVLAMATSAARDAANAKKLFDMGDKYGIPIQVIPGHKEAEMTFMGACSEKPNKNICAVIDVGGGSTEVVYIDDKNQVTGHSIDVGSVRLTELFVTEHPIALVEIDKITNYVKEKIAEVTWDRSLSKVTELVCVAGTPTTLASVIQKIDYKKEMVDGFKITREQLQTWRDRMADMNLDQRKALRGMDPLRADVIVTGATILLETAKMFTTPSLLVSDRGVRYGIALEMGGQ